MAEVDQSADTALKNVIRRQGDLDFGDFGA
jgi:hypothetical protein